MSESARLIRNVTEREVAVALILEYAERDCTSIALMGFYDDDCEFLQALAIRLRVEFDNSFTNKLRKVIRNLVSVGVFHARMRGTHKEYFGEPSKQMEYSLKPGKAALIRRGKTDFTMTPEDEAAFLIRRAYPPAD